MRATGSLPGRELERLQTAQAEQCGHHGVGSPLDEVDDPALLPGKRCAAVHFTFRNFRNCASL